MKHFPLLSTVPELIPSHMEYEVFAGSSLMLSCTPSEGQFVILWQHNGVTIEGYGCPKKRNAQDACLFPSPYNNNLSLYHASLFDSGIYTCNLLVNEEIIISQNINVTVTERKFTLRSLDLILLANLFCMQKTNFCLIIILLLLYVKVDEKISYVLKCCTDWLNTG